MFARILSLLSLLPRIQLISPVYYLWDERYLSLTCLRSWLDIQDDNRHEDLYRFQQNYSKLIHKEQNCKKLSIPC